MGEEPDPIRVLHVDDDPEFLELAERFLRRADERFEVETAANVATARRHLEGSALDCIVCDHELPDGTGLDFLGHVRDVHADLPFVLFTGRGSETIASEAISAGITDYIQKGSGTDQYEVLANRIENAVERHRSERRLDEQNRELRRYERMVNSMGEGACIYDAEGRFELVNEYLAAWFGTTRTDLEGRRSVLIPRLRNRFDGDPYAELLSGERDALSGQIDAEFPGHGRAVVAYNLAPLRVHDEIDGVVGIARDVTERTEREAELDQSRARLRVLFDQSPDMINIHDLDGTIIDPNPRLCEETGYSRDELAGMKVWEVDETVDPAAAREFWATMDPGDRERFDGRFRRRDGSTVPVGVHIRRLDLEGEDRFVAISRVATDAT